MVQQDQCVRASIADREVTILQRVSAIFPIASPAPNLLHSPMNSVFRQGVSAATIFQLVADLSWLFVAGHRRHPIQRASGDSAAKRGRARAGVRRRDRAAQHRVRHVSPRGQADVVHLSGPAAARPGDRRTARLPDRVGAARRAGFCRTTSAWRCWSRSAGCCWFATCWCCRWSRRCSPRIACSCSAPVRRRGSSRRRSPSAQPAGHEPGRLLRAREGARDRSSRRSRVIVAGRAARADRRAQLRINEIIVAVRQQRGGVLPLRALLDCRLDGVRVTDLARFFERVHGQVPIESLKVSWLIYGNGYRQDWRAHVREARVRHRRGGVAAGPDAADHADGRAADRCSRAAARSSTARSASALAARRSRVLKFRSMRHDAEEGGKARWAVRQRSARHAGRARSSAARGSTSCRSSSTCCAAR